MFIGLGRLRPPPRPGLAPTPPQTRRPSGSLPPPRPVRSARMAPPSVPMAPAPGSLPLPGWPTPVRSNAPPAADRPPAPCSCPSDCKLRARSRAPADPGLLPSVRGCGRSIGRGRPPPRSAPPSGPSARGPATARFLVGHLAGPARRALPSIPWRGRAASGLRRGRRVGDQNWGPRSPAQPLDTRPYKALPVGRHGSASHVGWSPGVLRCCGEGRGSPPRRDGGQPPPGVVRVAHPPRRGLDCGHNDRGQDDQARWVPLISSLVRAG